MLKKCVLLDTTIWAMKPLHDLTKKDVAFEWRKEHEEAFRTIQAAITANPVLVLPALKKPFEVETDASDYTVGGQTWSTR